MHYLASNMQAPTQRHMQAAERVLRYLAGTKDVGLVFGSRNGDVVGDSRGRNAQVQVDVCAFADADWANSKGDRKSISGWVAKLNGDPVSWSSKKQRDGGAVDLRGGAVRGGGCHSGGAVAARPDGGAGPAHSERLRRVSATTSPPSRSARTASRASARSTWT